MILFPHQIFSGSPGSLSDIQAGNIIHKMLFGLLPFLVLSPLIPEAASAPVNSTLEAVSTGSNCTLVGATVHLRTQPLVQAARKFLPSQACKTVKTISQWPRTLAYSMLGQAV